VIEQNSILLGFF